MKRLLLFFSLLISQYQSQFPLSFSSSVNNVLIELDGNGAIYTATTTSSHVQIGKYSQDDGSLIWQNSFTISPNKYIVYSLQYSPFDQSLYLFGASLANGYKCSGSKSCCQILLITNSSVQLTKSYNQTASRCIINGKVSPFDGSFYLSYAFEKKNGSQYYYQYNLVQYFNSTSQLNLKTMVQGQYSAPQIIDFSLSVNQLSQVAWSIQEATLNNFYLYNQSLLNLTYSNSVKNLTLSPDNLSFTFIEDGQNIAQLSYNGSIHSILNLTSPIASLTVDQDYLLCLQNKTFVIFGEDGIIKSQYDYSTVSGFLNSYPAGLKYLSNQNLSFGSNFNTVGRFNFSSFLFQNDQLSSSTIVETSSTRDQNATSTTNNLIITIISSEVSSNYSNTITSTTNSTNLSITSTSGQSSNLNLPPGQSSSQSQQPSLSYNFSNDQSSSQSGVKSDDKTVNTDSTQTTNNSLQQQNTITASSFFAISAAMIVSLSSAAGLVAYRWKVKRSRQKLEI